MDDASLHDVVDTNRYPITGPPRGTDGIVSAARRALDGDGCCVLEGFVRAGARDLLRAETEAVAPLAYRTVETVNVYNVALDADLPGDHPGRLTMRRGNAFVARDLIPADSLIHRLYTSPAFQRFVARCFGLPSVVPLADPLAGLCVNVVEPGLGHPWHFDTNEFTVSMLTAGADAGGVFEYCPGIRSGTDENLAGVKAVLDGHGHPGCRRLHLKPGDLQLFAGRYSLHRVTTVEGRRARLSAIFAYTAQHGVVGTAERSRQLFGRILPVHEAAAAGVRADALLD